MAPSLELRLNIDEPIKKLVLYTDFIRIKQVFSILLNNALKFTNFGFIEIGCKNLEHINKVEFYVKDTGLGISMENKEVIFQRFRKADDSRISTFRGAGLGLSIAQHLMQLLGGEIRVESEINKGSSFFFSVPLKKSTSEQKEEPKSIVLASSQVPNLENKLILIAEDDNANYAFIERLIRKTKAKVLRAVNGIEVIELVKKHNNISLILMDIKMPEMNGMEAFAELQKLKKQIPVVAQTAYAFTHDIQMIKEAGFSDYVSKPINPAKLFTILSNHVAI
jgi:CheY-like chemotaxis protein